MFLTALIQYWGVVTGKRNTPIYREIFSATHIRDHARPGFFGVPVLLFATENPNVLVEVRKAYFEASDQIQV